MDVKLLLVDVDGVGPCSQTAHRGQIAAVAPHGLDDEDPPLGAAGRLLDAVTRLIPTQVRKLSKERFKLRLGVRLWNMQLKAELEQIQPQNIGFTFVNIKSSCKQPFLHVKTKAWIDYLSQFDTTYCTFFMD